MIRQLIETTLLLLTPLKITKQANQTKSTDYALNFSITFTDKQNCNLEILNINEDITGFLNLYNTTFIPTPTGISTESPKTQNIHINTTIPYYEIIIIINNINKYENYTFKDTAKNQEYKITTDQITTGFTWLSSIELNTKYYYQIYKNIDNPTPEYKDYNEYTIDQSKLITIRTNQNTFESYGSTRFNQIDINNQNLTLTIQKNQKVQINYSNKTISIPILGTTYYNNEQYNIIDFYYTKNNNTINMFDIFNNDIYKYYGNVSGGPTSGYHATLNNFQLFFSNTKPTKDIYNYTYNNAIQIQIENPIGNAILYNNSLKQNLEPFATSLFGVEPLTKSYFGLNEPNTISQSFTSGLNTNTYVYTQTNYNKNIQLLSYLNQDMTNWQQRQQFNYKFSLDTTYQINLIAFPTNTQNTQPIIINDITILLGAFDNLENIGIIPFTFGSLIFIGLLLGFIMILIKILK